ncbi:circularly permuted type 2 ATP-grasp protein [Corynebacterium liangguodongii]|uniref:circularly permuted type 2 ATP-grasp protein n=1 Tax=Corynebacterium liangguodongii TaxID=2079535 RepID=UPI0011B204CA|nr:circularly permuted type 2 ATP-grasp protein [Corynebacterium liangguodongii]
MSTARSPRLSTPHSRPVATPATLAVREDRLWRAGGTFGNSVGDAKAVYAFVAPMIEFCLGERSLVD